ncbi:TetR/AcrR family transcriptional regulator [Pseudomonas sp. NPDC087342]|uniref:TetR/AcrR family transcriptional regulator n=1 Tax=Pseudomonas sp. NPDC087342 TaxID=3364437 RepID=UPI0038293183
MKKTSQKTYDRILNEGLNMLTVTGLSGVTFGALAEALGMSKSGLFAHFRSKDDIQLRLLEHADSLAASEVIAPAMLEPPGLPRLDALMRNWLGWTRRIGLRGGCPIASAFFELDDLEGGVREHVRKAEAGAQALLSSLVSEAIAEGTLRNDVDVDQMVWELRSIYLGHHVSSRFLYEPLADERAMFAFKALVDRYRRSPE